MTYMTICQRLFLGLMTWSLATGGASAGAVSQTPLFLSTSAKPNIMLLLDNSGSMQNIVPEGPFDATADYVCNPVNLLVLTAGTQVDIRINTAGVPYLHIGGTDYDWGRTGTGTGVTGLAEICFDPAVDGISTSIPARLTGDSGTNPAQPGGYLAGAYSGKYLNWYFGSSADGLSYLNQTSSWGAGTTRKPGSMRRMDIAQVAAKDLVDSLDGVRVGLATYNGSVGAQIAVAVADVASNRVALKAAIDALTPSGSTPLAESLHQIGRYFVGESGTLAPGNQTSTACRANGQYDGNLLLHPLGTKNLVDDDILFNVSPLLAAGVSSASPICYHCQKNFVIAITDGRPQGDQNIPVDLADYDGDCPTCAFDQHSGRTYESEGSDYFDDVAQALYEIDLRPDIDDADGNEVVNNISTYTIGFADPQVINDPLMQDTATNGGGLFLTAGDSASLVGKMGAAVSDIISKISSASAVTTSSTRLDTDTNVFQARFNSADWSGQLLSVQLTSAGTLSATNWDAAEQIPLPSSRKIFSWFGSAGYAFDSTNLATIASAGSPSITADQINYLRGDTSNEVQNGGTLRNRPSQTISGVNTANVLGDVVNSDPLFIGRGNFGFTALGGAEGDAYLAFRKGTSYLNRAQAIYVGANDGMLHAFNDSDGVELFAYVPKTVVPALPLLTQTPYAHQYFVDGSPQFGDAYIDHDHDLQKSWRTVLLGTTGAGGSGVFALDVTDPASFSATDVLWELDSSATGFTELGKTLGEASIARMPDGNFYALFGNGYRNSSDAAGNAVLYLVRLDDPDASDSTKVIALDTQAVAGSHGMSTPIAVDVDGDRITDTIYAGDLEGNLWKVDVTSSNPIFWDYAIKNGSNLPEPLFTARDASSAVQSITTKPQVGINPHGGVNVYFGTGKYFEDSDTATVTQVHTFYGIHDDGSNPITGRGQLQQQTIDAEGVAFGLELRVTSAEEVNPLLEKGWYLDLISPIDGGQGERVVSEAVLRGDRIIFVTLIPDPDPCGFGGSGWMMEVNALNGARLDAPPFDLNGDGLFDAQDEVQFVDINGNGTNDFTQVSGKRKISLGLIKSPGVIDAGNKELKIVSGSSGNMDITVESKSAQSGREAWQQLH